MIKRLLAGGLIAGFAAGLLAALLHFAFVQNLILLGEQYETGALVHFGPVADATAAAGHDHAAGEAAQAVDHAGAVTEEAGAIQRNVLTVLFTALIYASYGILLAAGFALAEHFGGPSPRSRAYSGEWPALPSSSLLRRWGLRPSCPARSRPILVRGRPGGLEPCLPRGAGSPSSPWLLFRGRGPRRGSLAAPHVIGAPHLDQSRRRRPARSRGRVRGKGSWGWLRGLGSTRLAGRKAVVEGAGLMGIAARPPLADRAVS